MTERLLPNLLKLRRLCNMAVKILLPTALRQYTEGLDAVEVEGGTVREVLDALNRKYPALRRHLYDERQKLRNFVNVYLNQEDIRVIKGVETRVRNGDIIFIIPSVAGGNTPEFGCSLKPTSGRFFSQESSDQAGISLIQSLLFAEGRIGCKCAPPMIPI